MDSLTQTSTLQLSRLANPVIHGMWAGTELTKLELLTIASFLRHGHEFHLWAYDNIETPLPEGTVLRDATRVLPRDMLFRKRKIDPETGIGEGSLSGVSSDLFRYRVLHDHGGVWVDMDVTCLRPFDFEAPYLFRSHRVGCVGSIMKAPRGCQLMAKAYEATAAIANEDTLWLDPLRILSQLVQSEGLEGYVRDDIANPDMWSEFIRPLTERYIAPPEHWSAIHWMNEFFRTLNRSDGKYKGRQIVDYTPNKENPRPGSLLHELYRAYGLLDPWDEYESSAPVYAAAAIALPPPDAAVDILVASLTRGGAERIVVETAQALAAAGIATTVYVLSEVQLDYTLAAAPNLTLKRLNGSRQARLRSVALDLGQSGRNRLQTHLIPAEDLAFLWTFGIETIPVIHNARPGWRDTPSAYNHPNVPAVVAVADRVAEQLAESGLQKPVVTLRHEIQRRPEVGKLAAQRQAMRRRHDIPDDVLLIGMVGQFKLQKSYPRAIRVLAELRKVLPAKLLIIGSWDHEYGSGRASYEATMRLAVELGVVADVMTPGNLHPVEPYYPAFDIFLSTSVYEGLSISLLEALAHGCKAVIADAGGNREVLPPDAVLVEDGNDIIAYVEACLNFAKLSHREVPVAPLEPDLVPRLWSLLAPQLPASPTQSVLFLSKNLNIGGPQRALVNLLQNSEGDCKWIAGVTGATHPAHVTALAEAQIPVLSAAGNTLAGQAQSVMHWLRSYRLGTLCFWNVNAELKLLLAKLLRDEPVRLIDVSPGPMLFDELEGAQSFQRRIAFTQAQYFARLDHFVGLYEGGLPPAEIFPPEKTSIIPRAVAPAPSFVPLPPPEFLLPPPFDATLAIGTCCRIVPDKRLEFLLQMMDVLAPVLPGVSLSIVGGPDASSAEYFEDVLNKAASRPSVRWLGPHYTVQPFLQQFQLFVMVSDRQGCPNASLEAMAMGLPVIANRSGGTAEQVIDGVTGYLVETPEEMAQRVRQLLNNPAERRRMGQAARDHALTNFSIDGMSAEYRWLLQQDSGQTT
jgi:glycosyltransferase involved in cell wall biosynthesis